MKSLLKWWLIFSLTLLGLGTCVYFNIHKDLYAADVTRLSFFIISIFICTSIWIGTKTYKVGIQQDYSQQSEVGWFISESCLALGMVGTVTGFLIMLGTAKPRDQPVAIGPGVVLRFPRHLTKQRSTPQQAVAIVRPVHTIHNISMW